MNQNDHFIGPKRNWIPAGNRELIFGFCALLVGLFAANTVIFGGFRLGFAIAGVLSVALSWGYLRRCGCRGDGYTNAMLLLCLVIAAGFGWSADPFVKAWLLLFLLMGTNLSFCLMAGHNRFPAGSARSLFDGARTLFSLSCGKTGDAARGVRAAFQAGGALTQRTGAVLTGLGIAVPVLAVVLPLLISSDAAFEGLIGLLPDFNLLECFATVLGGTVLGLILYTRGAALIHTEPKFFPDRETKRFHVLTMNTALGAVCVVYLAYLFSQLAYFVGGFSGILPKGFTAAEYARRGFFEMACLCAVNLGLMTFGVSKVAREARAPGSTRAICLFLGLVTEFLVAAGVAKMALYIDLYGLTRLRVLTMVIMAFLGITTALVSIWLYVPKLQYMKSVMLIALILGAAVLWADVDTQVAKYNVTAYLNGDLQTVDLSYLMTGLGPGAVPYIEQLTDCDDPELRSRAIACLRMYHLDDADDFRELTFKSEQALKILGAYRPAEAADNFDTP